MAWAHSWSRTQLPLCRLWPVCLFSACVVSQNEVAAGCCCCSPGCGQLCQPLPGRNGVPRLETKVWWVSSARVRLPTVLTRVTIPPFSGRSYRTPSEEAQRMQIWLTNRKLVLVHNILADQGIKSYRLGMTQFADMVRTRGCFCHLCDSPWTLNSDWIDSVISDTISFWPGKWGVQKPHFSRLPESLQRFRASPGLRFLPFGWGHSPARHCWLEG